MIEIMAPSKKKFALLNAVKLGQVSEIKKLLTNNAPLLITDSDGNSPLHLAFISSKKMIMDLILQKIQQTSEYTNLKNNEGLSHFHIACTRVNGKSVEGFLTAGVNADEVVSNDSALFAGFTAAHFAVTFKSLEALQVLLKFKVDMKVRNDAGETPLSLAYEFAEDWTIMIDLMSSKDDGPHIPNFHKACLTGNYKTVKNFVDHGVNVNSNINVQTVVQSLSTPLHCAVESRDLQKVRLLLENGAKINSKNADNMTPLHLAFYIEELNSNKTVEMVNLLYESLEDKSKNQVDIHGLSYFHIAITRNDLPTLKKYLNNGKVDINKPLSQDSPRFSSYTPLQLAVWYQNPEAVELLVERGVDVNATFKTKPESPLFMAFEAGDMDFIELFLIKGAKINYVSEASRKTMLHLVAEHCCYQVHSRRGDQLCENKEAILMYMEQLVKLGVDVNAKDAKGNTAMHFIFLEQDDYVEYFRLLLDLGADVNLENDEGELPFNLDTDSILIDRSKRHIVKGCVIFYHHVQKLKAMGVKIHPKNEDSCRLILEKKYVGEEELMCRKKERSDEIDRMKNVMVGDATSLLDFLKLDLKRASLYANCKALKRIAEDEDLKKKYPLYGYLILLQYRKVAKLPRVKLAGRKRLGLDFGEANSAKRKRVSVSV